MPGQSYGYGFKPYLNVALLNVADNVNQNETKLIHLEVENLNLEECWILLFNKLAANVKFGSLTAVANHADGAQYTKVAHGLAAGDVIVHEGFTDTTYNGQKTVITIVDADNYTTSDTYTATGTGTFIHKPEHSYRSTYGDDVLYWGSYDLHLGLPGEDYDTALSVFATKSTPFGIAAPTTGLVVNISYQ